MSARRGGLTIGMTSKSKRMFVPMMTVKGMSTNSLELCQVVGSKFDLIHNAYGGINVTLQVELYKVTKNMYNIRHDETGATFFKTDSSEGIGSPAKALLTFIRLKKV